MSPEPDPARIVRGLRFTTRATTDERILAAAEAARRETDVAPPDAEASRSWRTLMTSRWSGLATAAVVVIAAGLALALWDRSTAAAYALEQTLEANRGLRSFHARLLTETEHGRETSEIWMELDGADNLGRLRMDLSHAGGGPKIVIWEQGKARVFFPERNLAVVVSEPDMPDYVQDLLAQVDPTVTMSFLHEARAAGRINVRTIEPETEGDAIRLVATFPDNPDWKDVYLIDPVTKLVRREESFARVQGALRPQRRVDYLQYNQPLAENVFVLDLPDDVTFIDQTIQEVGLARGEMTEAEVAVGVARELFEALIAGDHARAGQLADGLPADKVAPFMRRLFGVDEFVGIVSIGQAVRDTEYAETAFLCVPCEIEVLINGKTAVVKPILGIRPVHGRPDRWSFSGTCGN